MNYPEPIAIIGMGCRYPAHCNNPEEFWQLLVKGNDGVGPVPPDRIEKGIISTNYKYSQANYLHIPIDEFDARFFEVSPATATFMDPQLRLLLEVVWAALEDSSVNPKNLRGTTTGIFLGSWLNDYQKIGLLSPEKDFFRVYMGNSMAARMAFFLGTLGPAMHSETACSSSMVAVHLACQSLRDKSTNLAIVGGVNLMIEAPPGVDLDIGFATCLDGRCKSFDKDADGYGRAEGCGVIILKRLSDALRDEDTILALIKGSAVTQEGLSRSMGTPTVHSEALAMSLALKDAGVDPADISYIEAHGTGTKVGDPIEVAAISKVYSSKSRSAPLIIGTVKANVGHSEACSGITSIIKVILAMKYKTIPKHLNFKQCNPNINFEEIPAVLPIENIDWYPSKKGKLEIRIAGVSSFGISGTDCHVILQEFPEQSHVPFDKLRIERPLHIMVISAKTAEALELLIENYCEYFEKSENKLKDIAFTTNIGRELFDHRVVVVAGDKAEAFAILKGGHYFHNQITSVKQRKPKICMLFPGQGSHYPGMANELYKCSPIFQQNFDECCKIILEETVEKIELKSVLWEDVSGDKLNKSINSQLAIFCVDYCLFKLWESWGVKPDYVLGHSLGESAAVVAVGVRDLRNGLKALLLKCQLVDELAHGKMIAVRIDHQKAKKLILEFENKNRSKGYWLDIAAINSPEQTVISGEMDCVDDFHKYCMEKGVKSTIIKSSHAFHSRMLEPVMNEIKCKLAIIQQTIKAPTENEIKYISSSEAKVMEYNELLQEDYWVANTRNTVRFMEACKGALNEGCEIFIELGAQPILSALVKANWNDNPGGGSPLCLPTLRRNENNWETLLNSLAQLSLTTRGDEINWKGFDNPYSRKKVSLPHYPFIRKSYWINKSQLPGLKCSSDILFNNQMECGHPLLGFQLGIASDNIHIFQNHINLSQEGMEYFGDHSIGNSVIFPGAGFLEVALAAGMYSLNSGDKKDVWKPVLLENFKITCPLQLETERNCKMQIILKTTQTGKGEVKISHFTKNVSNDAGHGNNWLDHASSEHCVVKSAKNDDVISSYDFSSMHKDWIKSDHEITQLYQDQLPQIGLHFGKLFQTLTHLWRDPNYTGTIIVALKIQQDILKQIPNYHIHPVLGDAMIQSTLLLLPRNILHVPVVIKRFLLIENVGLYKTFYVHCKHANAGDDDGFTVSLLDEGGVVLALMEGLRMHGTTVKNVEARLVSEETGGNGLPKFWQEEWRPSNLTMQSENFTSPEAGHITDNNRWLLIGAHNEFSENIQNFLHGVGEGEILLSSNLINNDKLQSKEALFKLLDNQVGSLGGILYLKGLCEKEDDQEDICLEFLFACQWLQANYHLPQVQSFKVAVITQGLHLVKESDEVFNPAPSTLGGMINTLKSECPKLSTKWIDLSHKPSSEEQVPDICRELLDIDGWKDSHVALRYEQRYVAKFAAVPAPKIDANVGRKTKGAPLFKGRCNTYMVTGGLSGLGFQVARWILENGARHMILVGRSSPKPDVSKVIKDWNESGKRVHVFNADVGNWNECNALFNWMRDKDLPPLRGIFHCAGVLADASISNQTWNNFETVFGPKVNGSWNLHKLALFYQLDYFVMFSSISSLFGVPGQINYAAGNCYEDTLAQYRHSLGLPATSINWGNWEEVGMAAHHEFPGLKPINIKQGLQALGVILGRGMRQVAVANFHSFRDFVQLCPRGIGYVDEKLMEGEVSNSLSSRLKQKANKNRELSDKFRKDMDQVTEGSEKSLLILKYIDLATRNLLKMDASETIDVNVEFHSLGIDSLMMMELQDKLQEIFGEGLIITAAHLRDFPSMRLLSDKLAEQLNNK